MIDIHAKGDKSTSVAALRAAASSAMSVETLPKPAPPDEVLQPPPRLVEIETETPFSESVLWQWQRAFYEQAGEEAWRQRIVPHYVTSNSWVCKAYAQVAFGWLRDLVAQGQAGPVYLVELGAGSGQFAFHFLRHFVQLFAGSVLEGHIEWHYVLTDFAQRNLHFCGNHPALQPFADAGLLDFAHFDATQSTTIELTRSGETLAPTEQARPIFAIANYFFDSIPQDLFWFENGKAYPCTARLALPEDKISAPAAEQITNVAIEYGHTTSVTDFYANASWNAVLNEYASTLQRSALLFPHWGLRCLEQLKAIAGEALSVVSGDKGYVLPTELQNRPLPGITRHGSLSLSVNYHAIKRWAAHLGGEAVHGQLQASQLTLCCVVFGARSQTVEIRSAFAQAMTEFGPDQQFVLKRAIERGYSKLSPEEIFAYIRLSAYDPRAFRRSLPVLTSAAASITAQQKKTLHSLVLDVWRNYYPLGEQPDIAFQTGVLFYELDMYEQALALFAESVQLYGRDAGTHCNMAMCWFQLRNWPQTTKQLNAALELEPSHPAAVELLERMHQQQKHTEQ